MTKFFHFGALHFGRTAAVGTTNATPSAWRVIALLATALLSGGLLQAASVSPQPTNARLLGRVVHQRAPIDRVRIYAVETAQDSWTRTETDTNGRFLFDSLAPGLYKLIAFKTGFVPAILMLSRGEVDEKQFVEIELGAVEAESDSDDFWSARRAIPSDVLRDLQNSTDQIQARRAGSIQDEIVPVRTEFQAFVGVDDRVAGNTVSGGTVTVDAAVGKARLELVGDYQEFSGQSNEPTGSSQVISLSVDGTNNEVSVTSLQHQLASGFSSDDDAVAMERHAIGWSRDFGRAGRSVVRAEFTEQSGFYSSEKWSSVVPDSSREMELMAQHTAQITKDHHLTAGFRYRETALSPSAFGVTSLSPNQRVDLFSEGGVQVQPRVLVQYGLVTTLRDGAVSFVPRGGAVVRLNDRWTASTLAAERVHSEDADIFGYRRVLADHYGGCQSGQKSCYQVEFARQVGNDNKLTLAATHREFDETLQLFFDEDLLDRMDTIYLVDGDQLPEVSVSYTSRWSPAVSSRLESSLAIGGGGQVVSNLASSKNDVQYLVTSLDTHFERSDTGVYIAFQQLQQSAESLAPTLPASDLNLDKLQLRLTQDLDSLVDAANIALRLSIEFARGQHPNEPNRNRDDIRQRLTGGVSLSF